MDILTNPTLMRGKRLLETLIFNVRWFLNVYYVALVAVMFMFGYGFLREVAELFHKVGALSLDELKLVALDMADSAMVANLLKMIITGSYHSFVSKKHQYPSEAISSGMLKNKISSSVLIVASIHLLKEFVTHVDMNTIVPQLAIFVCFLLASRVLGDLEYLHIKGEVLEHGIQHEEPARQAPATSKATGHADAEVKPIDSAPAAAHGHAHAHAHAGEVADHA